MDRLARQAHGTRLSAAALRWLAASALAFGALLVLALLLASFERGRTAPQPTVSAAGYLDFDLAVLRALATRTLAGGDPALRELWTRRPDWRPPTHQAQAPARLVSPREAWAAVSSSRSHFKTAARGAAEALPFLAAAIALSFLAAGLGGALGQLRSAGAVGRAGFWAGVALLVVAPALALVDVALFADRTRSPGLGFGGALFVAAFAGTLPGAAARALFQEARAARRLGALRGRPALLATARLAALDAADWLAPAVPALAAAALFVCAKSDQDSSAGDASGLGALVRAAMREPSTADRLATCALVAGALLVLWFLGHRLVAEVRAALGVARTAQ